MICTSSELDFGRWPLRSWWPRVTYRRRHRLSLALVCGWRRAPRGQGRWGSPNHRRTCPRSWTRLPQSSRPWIPAADPGDAAGAVYHYHVPPTALLDPSTRRISSHGRPPSWDLMTPLTPEASFSWALPSPPTTPSSRPRCNSQPEFTTVTSTRTAASVSTSWKINGHPHSPFPKFSYRSAPCSPMPTQTTPSCLKSPNFWRPTRWSTMLTLVSGPVNMQCESSLSVCFSH